MDIPRVVTEKEIEAQRAAADRERYVADKERYGADKERYAADRERFAAVSELNASVRELDTAIRQLSASKAESASLEEEKQPQPAEPQAPDLNKPGVPELTTAQKKAKALKELRDITERHRQTLNMGRRFWRALSVLFLHLLLLFIASAVFVWQSRFLNNTSRSGLASEYREDLIMGLIILVVVVFFLLLEYLRNWQKHKVSLRNLEKVIVDLANLDPDLQAIRTSLTGLLDNHKKFFGK